MTSLQRERANPGKRALGGSEVVLIGGHGFGEANHFLLCVRQVAVENFHSGGALSKQRRAKQGEDNGEFHQVYFSGSAISGMWPRLYSISVRRKVITTVPSCL